MVILFWLATAGSHAVSFMGEICQNMSPVVPLYNMGHVSSSLDRFQQLIYMIIKTLFCIINHTICIVEFVYVDE